MGQEELEILHAEWRSQVLSTIEKISVTQDKLADKIDKCVENEDFEKVITKLEAIIDKQQQQINELEHNKYFVLGIACILQIIVGWIIYFFTGK